MAGPNIRPFGGVGFSQNYRARLAQPLYKKGVLSRPSTDQGERTSGRQHAVGRVHIVFNENGNAVEWAARSLILEFLIERLGDLQCVRIELDHAIYCGTAFVYFLDSVEILLDH